MALNSKNLLFGFLFLRGDMNQYSQVKEYFWKNSKHWSYKGEVYFDCPYYLFVLKPF